MRVVARSQEPLESLRSDAVEPPAFAGRPPRGQRAPPHLSLEAAAAYATHVDAARVRAATEGRTLIYTIKWL